MILKVNSKMRMLYENLKLNLVISLIDIVKVNTDATTKLFETVPTQLRGCRAFSCAVPASWSNMKISKGSTRININSCSWP